jgi:hypothetical protein
VRVMSGVSSEIFLIIDFLEKEALKLSI